MADVRLLCAGHFTNSLGDMAPAHMALVLLQGQVEAGDMREVWVTHISISEVEPITSM